ncbi:hypothetical protein GE061_006187 [Apolygus lucorum]|uniref:Uncharacterized protein n=1 Tax=Apolygus lucorum TaxID=248454 RepID=A0A8S9WUK6_APOLU|nr:hypothetical protein GE061_006187 [Apolygus lucorum]
MAEEPSFDPTRRLTSGGGAAECLQLSGKCHQCRVSEIECPRRECVVVMNRVAEPTSAAVAYSEDVESVSSEEDNCRKKRCSDRYDSSESSDR